MKIVKGFYFFYLKLLAPLLVLSLLVGFGSPGPGLFKFGAAGTVFIFFTPLLLFAVYELRRPEEYYFYFNLGLSKSVLWVASCSVSLIIGFSLILFEL
jgi:hypothetical protein